MNILLLTNRHCHCVDVENELKALGLRYTRCDVEEHPDVARAYGVRHCPTLIVDEHKVIPIDEHNVRHLLRLMLAD